MITERAFLEAAKKYNLEAALIKAVAHVESRGDGFFPDGTPKILFEPHVFYKQLLAKNIDPWQYINKIEVVKNSKGQVVGNIKKVNPDYADILYVKWKSKPYGPSSIQHSKLERACKIDREAALMSASWGKFQIMGFNWQLCGCSSLQEFINKMYESEEAHLELFLNFLEKTKLIKALRIKDFRGFGNGYNGLDCEVNHYPEKLQAAYQLFK